MVDCYRFNVVCHYDTIYTCMLKTTRASYNRNHDRRAQTLAACQ